MSDEPKPLTPAEARQLWVKALRSGDYYQAQGWLKVLTMDHALDGSESPIVRHCCLGVACELYKKHVAPLEEKEYRLAGASEMLRFQFDGQSQELPDQVAEWLGLTSCDGVWHLDTYAQKVNYRDWLAERDLGETDMRSSDTLASVNDEGMTFLQIAELIESEPPGFIAKEPS